MFLASSKSPFGRWPINDGFIIRGYATNTKLGWSIFHATSDKFTIFYLDSLISKIDFLSLFVVHRKIKKFKKIKV